MTEQLSFTAALDRDALGRVAHQAASQTPLEGIA